MKTKKRIMDMEKDRLGATIQYLKYGEVTLQNFGFQRYEKLTQQEIKKAWNEHGKQIVKDWVQERPGSRPDGWWDFDAPEPREKLSGVGDPVHEYLAYAPRFNFGLPVQFISEFDEKYYNGRAKDIHGKKIGAYKPGNFKGRAIDQRNPPVYESEATYLRRLDLLLPGELERIPENGFDPIKIMDEYL